jgi:hypothetical protein
MLRRDNDEAIDALLRIARNRAMGVILRCDFYIGAGPFTGKEEERLR